MKLTAWLKKYFIPTKHNSHKPHFFREKTIAILAIVIAIAFFVSASQSFLLENFAGKNNSLAAVVSAVLVDLTNQSRLAVESDAPVLTVNPLLTQAAQLKADDMAAKGYFAHTSPDGTTSWHWFNLVGYDFLDAGENLAVNFSDSQDVVNAWMRSPGHRANILNERYTEVGIATAEGTYEGQPVVFVVQMFGRPKSAGPSSPVLVTATTSPALAVATPTSSEPVVVASPVGTPVVQGDATTTPNAPPKQPKPKPQKEIAVASPVVATSSSSPIAHASSTALAAVSSKSIGPTAATVIPQESTMFEKLITSPKQTLKIFYIILSVVVLLALVLMVGIEIEKQHPKNIVYGVILLLLMVGFAYASGIIFHPQVTAAASSVLF